MGELIGITGKIGSGKSTFADLLANAVEDHAIYESSAAIIEMANSFNQILEAELNYSITPDPIELTNQIVIWLPDVINQILHHDVTWRQLAISPKDVKVNPQLYEKLLNYIKRVQSNPKIAEQTITKSNKQDYRDLLQWLGAYFVEKISPTIWFDEMFRRIKLHDFNRSLVIVVGLRYKSDAAYVSEKGGKILKIIKPNNHAVFTDLTETQQPNIDPDIVVYNNGSLTDLKLAAENLWDDIAKGNLQKEYKAI